jgi:hypothetical protein
MKFRILSDLHLEYTGYTETLPSLGEDLVVLAGDTGRGTEGIEWAMRTITDRPAIYVIGNHEYHDHDWLTLVEECRRTAAGSNIHVLENESFEIGGLRVLGCTLWSDFRSTTASRIGNMNEAFFALHDYERIIVGGQRWLNVADTIKRSAASRWWLRREIKTSRQPVIVVTHHSPTPLTANPAYRGSRLNASFESRFHRLIRKPVAAWIHGRSHYSTSRMVNGVPIITNQRGYLFQKTGFDWNCIVDIDVDTGARS